MTENCGIIETKNRTKYEFRPGPLDIHFPTFCFAMGADPVFGFLPGCGNGSGGSGDAGGGGQGGGPPGPPPHPCTAKPGLSARDARYLCLYYEPMVTKASAYGVDPALPLGLGIESAFASQGTYLRTGDAFGLTGGSTAHMTHAASPSQDIDLLFSSGTKCGTPSYGERMRGTGSNVQLFLQRLELEDANGNQLTGPPDKNGNVQDLQCMYNSVQIPPVKWKAFISGGISEMQRDIPLFLNSQ